ncbi:MAG TPA: ABC transporter permease [Myxococcaceae bacterium]
MKALDREFREALRLFVRSPAFVAAVVLPMALALGANTALFTVIRGVLLRPLPYSQPERLVRIHRMSPERGPGQAPLSPLNYIEDLAPAPSVKTKAAWAEGPASLAGEGAPEHIRLGYGTASLLPVLGLNTAVGRWFSADEEQQGQHRRVVLSHALWLRRFGGDAAALGRTVQLEGEPYVIVGVLPPGIELPELCDAWVPLSFEPRQVEPAARNRHFLEVVARLAPGASLEGARRELAEAGRRTIADHPEAYASFNFIFAPVPMHEDLVRSVRPTLVLLLGAVVLVLLIACFNVGNLMLARATARQRELAIRSALGAGRSALVRKLLVESLVLAVTAGLVGLVLATFATSALLSLAPDALPRAQAIRPDLAVFAFSMMLSVASGVLFGLVPALSASDLDLEGTLRASGSMRPHTRRLRRILVMADVGLALMLLCAASLLLRSFVNTLGADPGFRADGVVTAQAVVPTPTGMDMDRNHAVWRGYVNRAMASLREVPGTQSVGGISMLPLSGDRTDRLLTVEGERDDASVDKPIVEHRVVTPGFFETLRIPLLQGRRIEDADRDGAPAVVVVNESFVRAYFPGGGALGKRIRLVSPKTDWATIVGVVGDVRHFGLDRPAPPIMYFPADQQPTEGMSYVVRSAAPLAEVSRRFMSALQSVDAGVPVFAVRPLESFLSASVAERRFTLVLVGTFAFLALLLAAVGLYGVIAYSVRQRTKEIGVRMAIGADAARIARLVAGESVRMVAFGLVVGLLGALGTARLLASFLYGVQAADPAAIIAAAGVLSAAAVVATLLPVRKATRVDPVIALAAE